jgi:hypothetical protein
MKTEIGKEELSGTSSLQLYKGMRGRGGTEKILMKRPDLTI